MMKHLQLFSKTSNHHIQTKLEDCFVLAVCPLPQKTGDYRFCGLNVCTVIKRSNIYPTYTEWFVEKVNEAIMKDGIVQCYLLDDNEVKIPFEIHGGNGWDSSKTYNYGYDSETCCYFGYVNPLMFGKTEKGRNYVSCGVAL